MRDPSGQGGRTDEVGGFAVADLFVIVVRLIGLPGLMVGVGGGTYVAQADILDQGRVNLGLGKNILQQRVEHEVHLGILETALEGLGQRGSQGEGDDNIIGVLLGAVSERGLETG